MTVGEAFGVAFDQAPLFADARRHKLSMIFHFDIVRIDHDNWRGIGQTLPTLKATDTMIDRTAGEHGWNQHCWAQRVNDLGIGTAHPPVVPTTDSLATALSHALQQVVAARAHPVADAVRIDGAEHDAQRLTAVNSRSSV